MADYSRGRVLRAASWYTAGNFISKSILYLCTPLFTRILTGAEYGQYSNFTSWQQILTALLTFDLSTSINNAYIDYKDEAKRRGFLSTITVLSFAVPSFFSMIILLFRKSFVQWIHLDFRQLVLLLSVVCLANTLGIFQAEQAVKMEYKLSSALTIGTAVGGTVLTFLLLWILDDKLLGILLGNTAFQEMASIVLALLILKKSRDIRWEYGRYALMIAVPLIPHVLAGTILGSSDKVMITNICGSEDNALYSLIYTITMVITMFASSVNKAWVPWFFDKLVHKDYSAIQRATRIMLPLGSVAAVGLCLAAPELIAVIGGAKYAVSRYLMPPLILHSVCGYYSTLYINIEFYNKKTFGISVATVIAAVVNLAMNYVFINRFGYQAAAYTTLFCAALTLCFHLYKVKRQDMLDVFDNKYQMLMLMATGVICLLTLPLYDHMLLRWALEACYIAALGIFFCLNRRQVKKVVDAVLGTRQNHENKMDAG